MKPTTLLLLLATAALWAACSAHDLFDEAHNTDRPIGFATDLVSTRALPFEEGSPNPYLSMGVYATLSDGTNLMDHQEVKRTTGSNGWSYEPLSYWPRNDKSVSFFAYAPHNAAGATLAQTTPGAIPTVTFTVSNDPTAQLDLLIADSLKNLRDTLSTAVHLKMRHALSRLLFSARLSNPVGTGYAIDITEITLSGLHNTGSRPLLMNDDRWAASTNTTLYPNTYTLSKGTHLQPIALSTTMQEINTPDGNLYLMPQSIPAGAEIKITVETTSTETTTQEYTVALPDILEEMKPGEAIRFLLTVPNVSNPPQSFVITPVHEAWNTEYTDAEINADPYLYISNEQVRAYDAAATRVYFNANQPVDKVFINSLGRVYSNTGTSFSVENEFYAIANTDPDKAINFHYSYSSTTKKGTGFIDLVQRNTDVAGENINEGKFPLILKLHAGTLVRDITVQPVVTTEAAKKNTTPYVGTFHRHNETGERLVTWHEPTTTSWTAEIDNSQGNAAGSLQIDQLTSLDFLNRRLYTPTVRDAEGTKVEGTAPIRGKGRVYFRVGWSNTTPAGTNRYGRINVTLVNAAGTTTTHHLYCRQGETPEQISAVAPSMFAIYNVFSVAEFTQYPSQVGLLYQWNSLNSWTPLGTSAPSGYAATTRNATFEYPRSACPEGYLFPSTNEVQQFQAVLTQGWNQWGYLADGYFDRRAITLEGEEQHRVNATSGYVASAGTLFYNGGGNNARSIFLPTGGYRDATGALVNQHTPSGSLYGGYWTEIAGANADQATGLHLFKGATASIVESYDKLNAHSLRCIKGNTYWVKFDANGGDRAPMGFSLPQGESANLPLQTPTDYWKDKYVFKEWNSLKAGTGTTYAPGASITPTSNTTLYAQWMPDPIPKFNLKEYNISSADYATYFTTSLTDTYISLTQAANGTVYSIFVNSTNVNQLYSGADKAQPYLQFGEEQAATTFAVAYNYCKNTYLGGGWRLPRVQEAVALKLALPPATLAQLFTAGTPYWTGTWYVQNSFAHTIQSETGMGVNLSDLTTPRKFRCVRTYIP